MKKITIKKEHAAKVCVELAGGGWTTAQTRKAMEYLRKLEETGKLKVKGYEITLGAV